MKTSWNDTGHIERYLNNKLSNEEKILFDAQMLLDPRLRLNVALQKRIHSLIRLYGRRKMKAELETIHHKLFHNPGNILFKQRIQKLFKDN